MVGLEKIPWSIQKRNTWSIQKKIRAIQRKIYGGSRKNLMVNPEKNPWSIQKKIHGRSRNKSMVDPEKIHGRSRKKSMVDPEKISWFDPEKITTSIQIQLETMQSPILPYLSVVHYCGSHLAVRCCAFRCGSRIGAWTSPLRPLHCRHQEAGRITWVRCSYVCGRYSVSWVMQGLGSG